MSSLAGRIVFLDILKGDILTSAAEGDDLKAILTGLKVLPDGIQIDPHHGHLYWTCMGTRPTLDDGHIRRCDFDGSNHVTILPPGSTHTPKQLQIDLENDLLYWSDREGMRVMRCKLDGSQVETLIDWRTTLAENNGHEEYWCVGIAIDTRRGLLYWTQKVCKRTYIPPYMFLKCLTPYRDRRRARRAGYYGPILKSQREKVQGHEVIFKCSLPICLNQSTSNSMRITKFFTGLTVAALPTVRRSILLSVTD